MSQEPSTGEDQKTSESNAWDADDADLLLITQGELMSRERFSAILRRNLGLDALRIPRDYETGQRNTTP